MATMTIEVPSADLNMFEVLVKRMGWMLRHEAKETSTYSRSEERAAQQRAHKMESFVDKFRTEEITEENILAECDAVRQEMYEAKQQQGLTLSQSDREWLADKLVMPSSAQKETLTAEERKARFLRLAGKWSETAEGEEYYQMMVHRNDVQPANREIKQR